MSGYLTKFFTILLFLLFLLFPADVFQGACNGLLLWFNSVLPTLLPFIILSDLLIRTHAVVWIVRVTGPLLKTIFRVSDYGSFAIVIGFLCGYPMGSKVIADLRRENHISHKEGQYLLSFCNNASPIFIISYIVLQNFRDERLLLPAILILLSAPVLSSFLFRRAYGSAAHENGKIPSPPSFAVSSNPSANLVDSCIMDGFENITKVGGYIMLFSIFLSLAQKIPCSGILFTCIFLPSLEITNGVALLCQSALPVPMSFLFCMACVSFGGLCAAAQTKCMTEGTGLSIGDYIAKKLVTAMVTSLLCLFYLKFLY